MSASGAPTSLLAVSKTISLFLGVSPGLLTYLIQPEFWFVLHPEETHLLHSVKITLSICGSQLKWKTL